MTIGNAERKEREREEYGEWAVSAYNLQYSKEKCDAYATFADSSWPVDLPVMKLLAASDKTATNVPEYQRNVPATR